MAFKLIALTNGDSIIIDNTKVVAVTQQTNRPATGTPTIVTYIFVVSVTEDSSFTVAGTAIDTMRKLGLIYTTTS